MKVQLLYFDGCPNLAATRERLRHALLASGLPTSFDEVDVSAADAPAMLREWGSPTILIDGRDVAGEPAPSGTACRLYRAADGTFSGVPTEDSIRAALREGR